MEPSFPQFSDAQFWLKFFRGAGLPQDTSSRYANLFLKNRMTLQNLRYLDKDFLKEMGISAVGDIITILQHCKTLDIDKLSEVQSAVMVTSTTPYPEKMSILPGHELPVPEKRRVTKEMEGSYVVKLPEGKTEKTRKILQKMGIGSNDDISPTPKTLPQSSRTVVITGDPSLTPSSVAVQRTLDFDAESDDDNEDFEVIISSTSPDVRTANLGVRPATTRPSVFDRLGAEVPSQKAVTVNRLSAALSPSPVIVPSSKSVLARVVDRTIATNAAETRLNASTQSVSVKRSASDSIFARLGTSGAKFKDEPGLAYHGVLKRSRLSVPQTPSRPQSQNFLKFSPNPQTRISAKSRLGFYPSAPAFGRSAGIFATDSPRNLHPKLRRP